MYCNPHQLQVGNLGLVEATEVPLGDERLAVFECVSGTGASACASGDQREIWTIRDLDGKVLRTWQHRFDGIQLDEWTWLDDNIFRDGQPLATVIPGGSGPEVTRHLHLDHLGSPRQITDATGAQIARHTYYPFGGGLFRTSSGQSMVRLADAVVRIIEVVGHGVGIGPGCRMASSAPLQSSIKRSRRRPSRWA